MLACLLVPSYIEEARHAFGIYSRSPFKDGCFENLGRTFLWIYDGGKDETFAD